MANAANGQVASISSSRAVATEPRPLRPELRNFLQILKRAAMSRMLTPAVQLELLFDFLGIKPSSMELIEQLRSVCLLVVAISSLAHLYRLAMRITAHTKAKSRFIPRVYNDQFFAILVLSVLMLQWITLVGTVSAKNADVAAISASPHVVATYYVAVCAVIYRALTNTSRSLVRLLLDYGLVALYIAGLVAIPTRRVTFMLISGVLLHVYAVLLVRGMMLMKTTPVGRNLKSKPQSSPKIPETPEEKKPEDRKPEELETTESPEETSAESKPTTPKGRRPLKWNPPDSPAHSTRSKSKLSQSTTVE
ncbi:hypothetical protein J8273_3322 [Carpediemonas membranifera]|uniref:Uncharacterized protein n=1 Tax=Carpediemonas membranifera TaxID=201153 RepID=A0A8J6E1L0_9EUKA|nr:hypothetical protein J8273_3322 [Carpediemonas membranifera]|eukprot:KAG9393191.1 hypothetical protein J8273_3322 [Carpediemonas membranifera]